MSDTGDIVSPLDRRDPFATYPEPDRTRIEYLTTQELPRLSQAITDANTMLDMEYLYAAPHRVDQQIQLVRSQAVVLSHIQHCISRQAALLNEVADILERHTSLGRK